MLTYLKNKIRDRRFRSLLKKCEISNESLSDINNMFSIGHTIHDIEHKLEFFNWSDSINLRKKPNYFKYFNKVFEDGYNIKKIDSLFTKILCSNFLDLLPKNPISYENPDKLEQDIDNIQEIIYLINNSAYKTIFKPLEKDEKKRFLEVVKKNKDIFQHFRICDIENFCKENNFNFINPWVERYQKLISLIENDGDVELIYNKKNIVIIQVFNNESAKKFGSKKWCLKNKESWKEYVGKKSQYFVYNFNYHYEFEEHLLGFTIKPKKKTKKGSKSKVSYIFDQENSLVWDEDCELTKKNAKEEGVSKWIVKIGSLLFKNQ
jgi:hypothetical protein